MRITLFVLIAFCAFAFKSDKFVKVEVNENITVYLPDEFVQLPQAEINKRQHSARKPLLFYTDAYNEVDFTVNMSYSLWGIGDEEILQDFYRSTIYSLYDDVNFIADTVVTHDDRKFVEFEFESVIKDDENAFIVKGDLTRYTLIRYTILQNNNTVVFSFSCPLSRKEKWQDTAREIMNRITLKY